MKRLPIRCFEGSAKPHERFWQVRVSEDDKEAEILFDGPISEFLWLGDEITPALFAADLKKLAGRDVTLRINSPGGDPIAASRMRAALTDYPGKVTARIDGICASAATVVALAADRILMQDSAFLMIHDPSVSLLATNLDIGYLESLLGALKSVKDSLVGNYETRTGISRERIGKMMSDETWMSSGEAVKFGFADEVVTGGVVAPPRSYSNALVSNFVNVPAALVNVGETVPESRNDSSWPESKNDSSWPNPSDVVELAEDGSEANKIGEVPAEPVISESEIEILRARVQILKRSNK
jgi:ATP-dependent Clp protease protease subunit